MLRDKLTFGSLTDTVAGGTAGALQRCRGNAPKSVVEVARGDASKDHGSIPIFFGSFAIINNPRPMG